MGIFSFLGVYKINRSPSKDRRPSSRVLKTGVPAPRRRPAVFARGPIKICTILFLPFLIATSANALNSKPYPALTGETLDGKNFDLKEKRERVVLVNFWASWCPDCRKELPILDEVYAEYQAQGLEIVGVSTDRKKDRAKVLKIAATKKYPNLLASDLTKNDFPEVGWLPTSYVIDRDGKLAGEVAVKDREITKKDFEDFLKPLLKK